MRRIAILLATASLISTPALAQIGPPAGGGGGGLGPTTPTNHAVQVGAGTSTLTQVGPGATTGVPLTNNASADPSYSGAINSTSIGASVPSTGGFTSLTITQHAKGAAGHEIINTTTAPSANSGFGTGTPTVSSGSTLAFTITVNATPSSALVVNLSATNVTNGWVCVGADITTPTIRIAQTSAPATGTASFTSYVILTGVATAPTAGDVILFICGAAG